MTDDRVVRLARAYARARAVEHAYAITGHLSQAATFDSVMVVAPPHHHTRQFPTTPANGDDEMPLEVTVGARVLTALGRLPRWLLRLVTDANRALATISDHDTRIAQIGENLIVAEEEGRSCAAALYRAANDANARNLRSSGIAVQMESNIREASARSIAGLVRDARQEWERLRAAEGRIEADLRTREGMPFPRIRLDGKGSVLLQYGKDEFGGAFVAE